jgi:peptide-methionine (S)-S-oxide reductase
VGYAGGTLADPTYRRLGDHSESIEVDYDPSVLAYADLLDVFWTSHDARGASFSTQYRSAVFYRTEEERVEAEASRCRIEAVRGQVSTAIEPLTRFYRAEDYHQKYYLRAARTIMDEFRAMYADDREFVDSTAAARVNGWFGGCGSPIAFEPELGRVGLSDAALEELRARLRRSAAGAGVGR